jgi:hypothetical protein
MHCNPISGECCNRGLRPNPWWAHPFPWCTWSGVLCHPVAWILRQSHPPQEWMRWFGWCVSTGLACECTWNTHVGQAFSSKACWQGFMLVVVPIWHASVQHKCVHCGPCWRGCIGLWSMVGIVQMWSACIRTCWGGRKGKHFWCQGIWTWRWVCRACYSNVVSLLWCPLFLLWVCGGNWWDYPLLLFWCNWGLLSVSGDQSPLWRKWWRGL